MNSESENINSNTIPQSNSSSKNEKEEEGNCLSYVCWIFQTMIWISIIILIIGAIINSGKMKLGGGIALGVSYLIYIILEFCLPKYLGNINNEQRMYEILRELLITPPIINFYAESYHVESRHMGGSRSKSLKYKKLLLIKIHIIYLIILLRMLVVFFF